MIISPFLSLQLRPKVCSWLKQSRNIRPTVKVGKDKFQLTIDVHHFSKDEIRVKARQEYVIIEGKQEKKTKRGFVMRQFVRKFKLPEGCNPESMESKLSPDGLLTITAPRKISEQELPCETLIPISYTESKKEEANLIDVKDVKPNPCARFQKEEKKSPSDDKKPE